MCEVLSLSELGLEGATDDVPEEPESCLDSRDRLVELEDWTEGARIGTMPTRVRVRCLFNAVVRTVLEGSEGVIGV